MVEVSLGMEFSRFCFAVGKEANFTQLVCGKNVSREESKDKTLSMNGLLEAPQALKSCEGQRSLPSEPRCDLSSPSTARGRRVQEDPGAA